MEKYTLVAAENSCFLGLLIVTLCALALLLERIQRQKFLAEVLLQQQMHAAETADSILNHMLKNTFADVAGYVELYLGGKATNDVLQDAMLCLRRGMRVCKERQAYLKVVAGTYTPMLHPVRLTDFARDLVAGRPVAMTDLLDATVILDSTLLTLILENAISNAIKHGCQENPNVQLTIRHLGGEIRTDQNLSLEFAVSNSIDEDRPLLDSSAVFQLPPVQGKYAAVRAPMLSDGIGLSHAKLAADVGKMAISLTQVGTRITFRAIVAAEIFTDDPGSLDPGAVGAPTILSPEHSSSTACDAAARPLALPPRLRFCVLDDSPSSLKLVTHQIQSELPDAIVKTFGAFETDVDLFTAMAVESADVVIVDQHLDYRGKSYLGTTLVRRLRLLGYQGLICIRSADDSPVDQAQYAQSGAHYFVSKNVGRDFMR
eukprot:TRINITY_DN14664_c0_g1_i1.p1 TRINITY_DN14664_c0_g1~~TRINITY_DN14664_c0_g1_i1.p1  ORF type:complete len:457 (+),score=94.21 TRINITY_DN14664_c0_g1_i1:82-1371(+)